MSEVTIDRLQIQIEAEASRNSKGLEKFIQSVEKLRTAVSTGIPGLAEIATKLASIGSAMDSIKGKSNSLNSFAKAVENIKKLNLSTAAAGMNDFVREASALGSIGSSLQSVRDFGKGVTSMSKSFEKLKSMDIDGVSDKIKELVAALKPLTDEMIRAGAGVSNFGDQMKSLAQALRSANSMKTQIAKQTQRSRSGTGGLNGLFNLGKAAALIYTLKEVGSALKGAVGNVNDYIEDINLFTVAMGSAAEEGRELAQKMQDLLGIDAGQAMRNMGVFQQMTTSFGVTAEKATVLSKNLTQLGYDMASLYNLTPDAAFEKLQAGISGETDPLRRLGIDISEVRLQQELYNLGIQESVRNLSQADKAQLRYIAIMEQTKNAHADMARTIMSPANALRVLQAQFQITARAIGSIFIPALQAILPYAIAVVKVIGMAASALASLLGFKMPDFKAPEISGGLGDISDGLDDVADSAKDAKKQVNYLISGFDELNILNKDSAAGAAGSIGGALDDLELPEYDIFDGLINNDVDKIVDKIIDSLKKLKDILMDLGLREVLDNFKKFFDEIGKQIAQYDFATAIKDALLKGFELAMSAINLAQRLVFPIIIALDVPGIVYEAIRTLTALMDMLNDAIRAVTPGLEKFVQIGLVPIAEWLGDKIRDGLKFLQEQFYKIGDWFTEHTGMFTEFGIALGNLTNALWNVIKPLLDSAWESFKKFISDSINLVLDLTEGIVKFLTPAINAIADWINDNQASITNILRGILSGILAYKAVNKIPKILEKLGGKFKDLIKVILSAKPAQKILSTMFATFKISGSSLKAVAAGFQSAGSQISSFLKNLSPMQKAAGTIAGVVAEFSIVSGAFHDLTMGTQDWGKVLLTIIPTIGLVGKTLSTMLGPVGWAITGIGALVGALKGWSDAQNEIAKADFASRFGDITLSLGEMQDKAREIVETESLKKILSTLEEFNKLDSIKGNIDSAADSLEKLNWKLGAGIEFSEDDIEAYKTAIDNYVSSMIEYADQRNYALSLSIDAIIDINDPNYESIKNSVDEIAKLMHNDLTDLGKELQSTVDTAFEDGLLDIDEQKAIETITGKINKIKDIIAESETQAKLDVIAMEFTGADLTPESYQEFIKTMEETAIQMKTDAQETVERTLSGMKANIKYLEYKLEEDPNNQEFQKLLLEAQNALDDFTANNPLEASYKEVDLKLENFKMDTVLKIAKKEIELSKSVFSQSLEETLQQGFGDAVSSETLYNMPAQTMASHLQTAYITALDDLNISPEIKQIIGEMMKSFEPTLQQKEAIAAQAKAAGESVPKEVAAGIADLKLIQAISGNMDAINYLIGQKLSNDPSYLEMLSTVEGAGKGIDENIAKGITDNVQFVRDGMKVGILDPITGETIEMTPILAENLKSMGITILDDKKGFMKGVNEQTGNVVSVVNKIAKAGADALGSKTNQNKFKEAGETLAEVFANSIRSVQELVNTIFGKLSIPKIEVGLPKGRQSYDRTPTTRSVPAFADGGVVREPTYALVGEYQNARSDPEVIAPQSTIKESVVAANGELVGALYQMATMIVQAIEDNATEVQQDPDAMFKVIRKKATNYKRNTGSPAF